MPDIQQHETQDTQPLVKISPLPRTVAQAIRAIRKRGKYDEVRVKRYPTTQSWAAKMGTSLPVAPSGNGKTAVSYEVCRYEEVRKPVTNPAELAMWMEDDPHFPGYLSYPNVLVVKERIFGHKALKEFARRLLRLKGFM